MIIDTKKVAEKVMSYYKNNHELVDGLTDEEIGYYKAMCDVMTGKFN
jgi:hypothetical protein